MKTALVGDRQCSGNLFRAIQIVTRSIGKQKHRHTSMNMDARPFRAWIPKGDQDYSREKRLEGQNEPLDHSDAAMLAHTSPKQCLMPRRRHIRLKLGQQNRKTFNVQSPHHLVHRDASSAGTV